MMYAPSEALKKKKHVVLLAVLGVAAVVGNSLLGADFSAFEGGGGRDSDFRHRQLRKEDDSVKARKLLWKTDPLANFIHPQTVTLKEIIKKAVTDGRTYFQVHHRMDDGASAIFLPSEIMIEVLNPKPNCIYSVTVESHNLYTGTAMLLAEGQFSWKPILPGQYDVLVHEIDLGDNGKTPLIQPPHTFLVTELIAGTGLSMLEDRLNMPPCQIRMAKNVYSHWEGDWLGPDFRLENSIRTGWSFLPSSRMNCKLETFDSQALQSLPEKKLIYILGRSVGRGIFLSLVDIMLDEQEKRLLKHSVVGKCWGRAAITKGNVRVVYQDFRSSNFEDPTEPPFIECHNDKLVKYAGSSFITNATKLWEEIFQQDEYEWPSVIYFVTGYMSINFKFDYHVKFFVDMLPPTWQGTMFIGDPALSGRYGGYVSMPQYEEYLAGINGMRKLLKDPRVRWIDGHGISKEMRMYNQDGEEYMSRSQHFHRYCASTKRGINGEFMTVCSNVTEMMGQLLLGHAVGPKADFTEQVKRTPSDSGAFMWCHACPKCMLPLAIVPYPNLTCVTGPISRKENYDFCPAREEVRTASDQNSDPLLCPLSCLDQEVTSEFGSESDTVFVRQCPILI